MAKLKYDYASLEVNQTLEIESSRKNISAGVSQYGKRHGKKFSTQVKDGKIIVTRVS